MKCRNVVRMQVCLDSNVFRFVCTDKHSIAAFLHTVGYCGIAEKRGKNYFVVVSDSNTSLATLSRIEYMDPYVRAIQHSICEIEQVSEGRILIET